MKKKKPKRKTQSNERLYCDALYVGILVSYGYPLIHNLVTNSLNDVL